MEMGCTVDTVYNALNLSNPTTGAQPDRIRRRAMELGGKENRKSAGSIIDAPTSRANENSRKKEVVLQTATKSSTTSCFRTMLCANNAHRQKRGAIGRGGISRNTKRKRENLPFPLISINAPPTETYLQIRTHSRKYELKKRTSFRNFSYICIIHKTQEGCLRRERPERLRSYPMNLKRLGPPEELVHRP